MQCPTCSTTEVTAYCRKCGLGVCPECLEAYEGVPHCRACAQELRGTEQPQAADEPPADASEAPRRALASPVSTAKEEDAPPDAPHPVLAGILGFVPGLGAVYNGQYVKGVIHVCLFGLLMAIATSDEGGPEAFFIPLIALFILYMPIEAVRTAQALRRGQTVDEMSGLVGTLFRSGSRSPAAGVALIAVGILLLSFTLGLLDFEEVVPFWPLLVIVLGAYKLWLTLRGGDEPPQNPQSGDSPAPAEPKSKTGYAETPAPPNP